jgi:hypothetical protein
VADLDQQLQAQTTHATALAQRVEELDAQVAEQARIAGEREHDSAQLHGRIAVAAEIEASLRAALEAAEARHRDMAENVSAERDLRQKEMAQANTDRAALQAEIAAMKREAEASWVAERVENALLRERINDVAAEVARLTVVLEGPESPIEAILAAEPGLDGANGGAAHGELIAKTYAGVQEAKGNLGERMRALQSRTPRMPAN